ncbi:hypothetical protein DFH06DRAFT_1365315 [Mycena polygramma]|nr:hypothetical protein DFH06DRAFT_1365315 [Mycena polygramma]
MSGLHFLDLPTELIIKALAELSVFDLRNCEATNNRFLSGLIRDSASLHAPGWTLRINTLATVTVKPAADSWKLVSDIYFMAGDRGPISGLSDVITYAHIQSPQACTDANPEWKHIEIGQPVVDFAAAIDEHNLMAVVTYTPHDSDTHMLSVDIVLLDFSTGKPHRLAIKAVIHVHDAETFRNVPEMTIDIAGNHLLLATLYDDEAKDLNLLYIFDWESGLPRMARSSCNLECWCYIPRRRYNTVTKRHRQLVGNLSDTTYRGRRDYPLLPSSPLVPSYCVTSIICKGSPSCLGSNSHATPASRRRYTSDFKKSLVVVSFEITVDDDDEGERFLFVFLRNEFMDMLEDRTNRGHFFTEWFLWGRPLTRWLNMNRIGAGHFYSMSYGRRFVWISDDGDDLQPIWVLDFNPDAVNLVAEIKGQTPRAVIYVIPRSEVSLTRYHAFQSPIESTLPYVETISPENFSYHCVAMNEDNLLGITFDDSNNFAVQAVDILQFGTV